MECYCYLRNVTDLLSDGNTPCKAAIWWTVQWTGNSLWVQEWTITQFLPMTSHVFTNSGRKFWPGKFLRYALYVGGRGHIVVVDLEELDNFGAPEVRARRLNAKEVITTRSDEKLIFPIADWKVKLFGDQVLRKSTFIWEHPEGAPGNRWQGTSWKRRSLRRSSWRIRRVSTIRLNSGRRWSSERLLLVLLELFPPSPRGSKSQTLFGRKKNQINWRDQSHAYYLKMSCRKAVLMIIGTLMGIEICQRSGQHSPSSQYWMRYFQTRRHGPERDWRKSEEHRGQILCGQKYCQTCQKQVNQRKSKNGLLRSRSSTMQGRRGAFILSIQRMKSWRKPWRTRRRS